MPFANKIIHARWSGESTWILLGDFDVDDGFENHTNFPAPGEVLIYAGGDSEIKILFPYGVTRLASTVGQLAGNYFLTITASGSSRASFHHAARKSALCTRRLTEDCLVPSWQKLYSGIR